MGGGKGKRVRLNLFGDRRHGVIRDARIGSRADFERVGCGGGSVFDCEVGDDDEGDGYQTEYLRDG